MNNYISLIKKNFFSTKCNALITLGLCFFLYTTITPLFKWAFTNATFIGDSPDLCSKDGACWIFVKVRFNQFMYGFYPKEEQWRINFIYVLGFISFAILLYPKTPKKVLLGTLFFILYPLIAFLFFYGGILNLKIVETNFWGGLHLTLLIAFVGILISIPFGILLALGRRSKMPIINMTCIVFIEIWRGVPLLSVLFMMSVMFPLFLPEHVDIDKLLRVLIGFSCFFSAYMAEVVRGGLQAVNKGQFEAAKSLGLNYWHSMGLIILPQALKLVLPGIVNTAIAIFKESTLVIIIGLFDLLGIVQAASTDPKWLAYNVEGYIFAAFLFWIFCFLISRYSLHLEHKLNTESR